MVNLASRTQPPVLAPLDVPAPVRSRRSTLVQEILTAILLAVGAVGDVLIAWVMPTRLDSCPPDVAILDCPDALTVTITPGVAAIGALLVWLVGTLARERRGGLAWCWIGAVVAFAPWVFAIPGLVFS
ncbi:hypothetical protein [Actinotalea fermentans]|uniref:Uncharacterized protein n=1 Tax=Actinotalea fermentans TaxID=43671 RepID=A0A511YVY0_9CELL|nr:hypothetical protein [Actinotalea fermentans]KGM15581.1 hypothetical protein N867_07210 [Actinotalea fermentans ATCC 43279 = JCM 9966 = DSM 3133]GEN79358.1 hypothetical protein AFE02nite_10920 [Actinotalea fermentans]